MLYEPTFMAYELRLLWHTNPDFYPIGAVFIGGGGGILIIWVLKVRLSSLFKIPVYQIPKKNGLRLAGVVKWTHNVTIETLEVVDLLHASVPSV